MSKSKKESRTFNRNFFKEVRSVSWLAIGRNCYGFIRTAGYRFPVVDVRFDLSRFGIIYRAVKLRSGTCEDSF